MFRPCVSSIKRVSRVAVRFAGDSPKQKSFFRQGPISWASFAITTIACGSALTYFQIQKDKKTKESTKKVETVGTAAIGGEWVLVNQDGKIVTDATFAGQYQLLYFGFTHCPDICPNELLKIEKIVDQINKKYKQLPGSPHSLVLKPIFVSVDPTRDSVDQLKYYSKDFHKDIEWLTGTMEQVGSIAKAFRVYFSKANEHEDDEEDYLVDHSIVLYLMSPDNSFIEFYTQRMLVNEIVDRISAQLDKNGVPKSI